VSGSGLETDDYTNTQPSTADGQWYYAIEKSLRRIIKEEVNLEIDRPKYLLYLTFIIPNGAPAIVLSFYANYKSGEVKLDEDSADYTWVTYEDVKNYDLIDGILEEIKMVDEILKGKSLDEVEFNH